MKKKEKIDIIKYYIKTHCCLGKIQTDAMRTDNIKDLEILIRNDRTLYNSHECATCFYNDRDYCSKCKACNVISYGKDECEQRDNYTFPYGYWKKFFDIDTGKIKDN